MDKTELLSILNKLLEPDTDEDLSFLLQLERDDLVTLVGCVRERVQNSDES